MGKERKQRVGKASAIKIKPARSSITRVSLISQAADIIREQISNGTWGSMLPGERQLSSTLQVSRPTLQRALKILQGEGLFTVAQGKQRVIQKGVEPTRVRRKVDADEIVLLCPHTFSSMPPSTHYLIEQTYLAAQKAGYKLRIETPAWLHYRDPHPYLVKHVKTENAACWALFSVSKAVQQWFSERSLPALVSGSCFSGVALPSIDFDYAAVTKHAVGTFRRKGFQRITLLAPEAMRAGDATTTEAFLEAIPQAHRGTIESKVIKISQDQGKLGLQLHSLLTPDHLPHALFVAGALNALYVLSYLLEHRFKIGTEVALICRDEDFFLNHLSVKPSCYRINKEKFATRFCRMLLKLAQAGTYPEGSVLITPEFLDRDTL